MQPSPSTRASTELILPSADALEAHGDDLHVEDTVRSVSFESSAEIPGSLAAIHRQTQSILEEFDLPACDYGTDTDTPRVPGWS